MKKKIFIIILLLAVAAYFGYNYVMAAPEDISKAKIDLTISATDLAKEFSTNEKIATAKFQEKVIVVSGTVTGTENKSITIDNKITCGFENKIEFKKGDKIKVKGLFIGWDELLEEVKFDKCSIIK